MLKYEALAMANSWVGTPVLHQLVRRGVTDLLILPRIYEILSSPTNVLYRTVMSFAELYHQVHGWTDIILYHTPDESPAMMQTVERNLMSRLDVRVRCEKVPHTMAMPSAYRVAWCRCGDGANWPVCWDRLCNMLPPNESEVFPLILPGGPKWFIDGHALQHYLVSQGLRKLPGDLIITGMHQDCRAHADLPVDQLAYHGEKVGQIIQVVNSITSAPVLAYFTDHEGSWHFYDQQPTLVVA